MQTTMRTYNQSGSGERRRGGLVFPFILITIGVVFLLNNLGILSWNVWPVLFRMWPVLLIAAGLDILIGRRSLLGSVIVLVVMIIIVAVILGLTLSGNPIGVSVPALNVPAPFGMTAPQIVSGQISQPVDGAARAEVVIDYKLGELRVDAAPEGRNLIEGTVANKNRSDVHEELRRVGDTARYSIVAEPGVQVISPFNWSGLENELRWDLHLNRDVPMTLRVNSGFGKVVLDLSRLQVTELRFGAGMGESEITMPNRGQVKAKIEGGIGQATVLIPRGMAYRIEVNGGLGNVRVEGQNQRIGDAYVSTNYEGAQDRIDMTINGGIGQLVVREITPN